jgi:hypothetical protein
VERWKKTGEKNLGKKKGKKKNKKEKKEGKKQYFTCWTFWVAVCTILKRQNIV